MGYQHYCPFVCVVFISILPVIYTHNAPMDYVNAHNDARKAVGLEPVTWNDTVAKFAKKHANTLKGDCVLVHSKHRPYGENLAMGWGTFSGLDAVKMWVGEKAYYHYESNTCLPGKVCGHYTQVVWRTSIRIGCARVKCRNNAYVVCCNYDPPGNYYDTKPY